MFKNKGKKRIAFVLTGDYAIGGAETRFVNAFNHLGNNYQSFQFYLVLSGKKFIALKKHNLIEESNKGVIVNCPHFFTRLLYFCYLKNSCSSGKNESASFFYKLFKRLIGWGLFFYNTAFVFTMVVFKKIDIIHPITEGSPPCGVIKKIRPSIKLVTSFLTLNPTWHKKGFYYLYSSQYLSLKLADIIDVLGLSYLKTLQKTKVPLENHRISISKCSFIKPFDVSKQKSKLVVFSGRLYYRKTPDLFIKAAKIVVDSGFADTEFLVLGTGPLKSKLEKMVEQYNINKNVRFFYSFNHSEIISKSLIFCSLNKVDNYPSQSLLQAMYAENGVIATDAGETNKLIKHNENGLLIKPKADELASSIMFYLKNPDQRQLMGRKAADFVKKNHNIFAFSDYLMSLYQKLD